MQIQTTLRFHPALIRMAIIKNTSNNRCWQGCGGKCTLIHCWWGCKLVQPLWKAVWRFLRKRGMEPPFDPAIPLLGLYPKDVKSTYIKKFNISSNKNNGNQTTIRSHLAPIRMAIIKNTSKGKCC